MRRRQYLASGAALLSVAVAGCGHPPVVLDFDEASDEDIADEFSISPDPGDEEYSVVSAAIENESATRRGRRELFDHDDTVLFEGGVYEVNETRTEPVEMTVYEVRIDFDPTNTTAELGEIQFDELPEVDRQRLDPPITEEEPPNSEGYDAGIDYGIADGIETESVLVPEQGYDIIVVDGNRYRVDTVSRTTTGGDFRYEVTQVAPDVESFADRIRDRYLFTLSGLSEDERAVVEEAIDGAYFEETDAFHSVVDRIREHEGISEDSFYGTWLLTYEGVEYLVYAEW
ncbi:hypothetical protein [Halovivax cerinus]|uniref:Uncharacterized protein n=1 Tax=Halovivax cerinus TaxID=1487865 RepID=A0ABD5NL82_9EURY|nr:hypothetical protein [Halovivax cerinus]